MIQSDKHSFVQEALKSEISASEYQQQFRNWQEQDEVEKYHLVQSSIQYKCGDTDREGVYENYRSVSKEQSSLQIDQQEQHQDELQVHEEYEPSCQQSQ